MNIELYFLRSSENKIIESMLPYVYRLHESNKSLDEVPELKKMNNYYGLTTKDLGLYALYNNKLAGAIWSRELESKIPQISMAVLPEFRGQGIGKQIMEQFLQEAGAIYRTLEVTLVKDSPALKFYAKFGFLQKDMTEYTSLVDGKTTIKLQKQLELKEVTRPQDNYDASYWMD